MATIQEMATFMRASFKRGFLEGMQGPTTFFADRFESRFVPPRSTDGWFEGQRLRDYQVAEAAVFRSVMPDAHHTDVTVLTRADDQIIVVMTLAGTLNAHEPYECPVTMVYDIKDGFIVRVIGLYDQGKLTPFADAFEELAKTVGIPIEMTARRGKPAG